MEIHISNRRVLKAARGLHRRYLNPDVAAFNRAHRTADKRTHQFWQAVGFFLFRPYPGMAWTDCDIARWRAITANY